MLVVISAPSGAGKDTIIRGVYAHVADDDVLSRIVELEDNLDRLVTHQNYPNLPNEEELPEDPEKLRAYLRQLKAERMDELELWVMPAKSMTTRPMKSGEREDSYVFVTKEYFQEQIKQGKLLEYAPYAGNMYGTPLSEVEKIVNQSKLPMKQIEAQGAQKVKNSSFPAYFVVIDVSDSVLEQRLRARGRDTEESIRKRLDVAKEERETLSGLADIIVYNEGDIKNPRQEIYSVLLELKKNYLQK